MSKSMLHCGAWIAVVTGIIWMAFSSTRPWAVLGQSDAPDKSGPPSSSMRTFALRLRPGQDLRKELSAFIKQERLRAGVLLTCVGSLTDVSLRYANREEATRLKGHFEIVSLVGTLDPAGGHLHLSVADREGRALGGHLLDGCLVYMTAEIVVGELTDLEFRRERDATYGYDELAVHRRQGR